MNQNDIRNTLDTESVRLSKALGQNLLHDQNVLQRITKAADLRKDDQVLEVGPGLGSLTEHLLQEDNELTVIEKDKRLASHLDKKFKNNQVTRPPYWIGIKIVPKTFEFWQGDQFRLHERELYYLKKKASLL